MNAPATPAGVAPDKAVALLRTVVICDLADSTALVERLGDQRAAEVFRQHDRLVRGLIRQHGGQEIDKTDGFLSVFERPIQGVAWALAYQRALRRFAGEQGVALQARTGIHVGDVLMWHNDAGDVAEGAKPVEMEGLVKPVAARLMALALPGQVLLSGVAYAIAHRAEGELGAVLERVRWRHHGRFRFKGVPDAVPVYEVGEVDLAPLRRPAWSGKAHREVPLWRRPAMLAIEAIAVLALIGFPLWQAFKPRPAIAFAERDWVVLADLRNLTGETRFDDALQEAFRIGLEQSRHVNVLSDLKLRDTLELMRRDPRATPVDREVGAEIALREGARALVVPTLAEVGGRVRFTAEVVDPGSQATVIAEWADGAGVESVLGSVDAVNRRLRAGLGEGLASVERDSRPLERVATAQLDALRAYTMAVRAEQENRLADALALLEQALEIDPEFARARVQIGAIRRNTGDRAGAVRELRAALVEPDRLSVREKLNAEALLTSLQGTPRENLEKWRLGAELYPDHFPMVGSYGFFAWLGASRYDLAIPALEHAASERNPRRGSSNYVLGSVLLGADRLDEALSRFSLSEADGRRFENHFYAATFAAQRRFDEIAPTLDRGTSSGIRGNDVSSRVMRAAFAVDQARFAQARRLLDEADEIAATVSHRHRRMVAGVDLTLALLVEPPARQRERLRAFVAEEHRLDLPADDPGAGADRHRRLLTAAWLAARLGDTALAGDTLAAVRDGYPDGDYPELAQRRALAQAALLAAQPDQAAAAVDLLSARIDDNAFASLRLGLLEAAVAQGNAALARRQATWLATHRGRAYGEMHGDYLLLLFNVAHSNLAHLAQAELALDLGEADAATAALATFTGHWPATQWPAPIADRVQALRQRLAPAAPGDPGETRPTEG